MGLERSGLALAVDRYCEAFGVAGERCSGWLLSNEQHPERFLARHASLSDLTQACAPDDIVLWVGLADEDDLLSAQLESIRHLANRRTVNLLMPERTMRPDMDAYSDVIDICKRGFVAGLVHFNGRQDQTWQEVVTLPSLVAAPPVPDRLFRLGAARLDRPHGDTSAELIFVGRLTARKRVSRLVDVWEKELPETRLHVFGRAFPTEPDGAAFIEAVMARERERLSWTPHFPSEQEIGSLGPRSIGVSLSRQEFDGIALSELLALGLPAVVSTNEGHLALSDETSAVRVCDSVEEWCCEVQHLVANPRLCAAMGHQAALDMAHHRSTVTIADRLATFLLTI